MSRKKNSESIRRAARHAGAAAELLMQLVALQSFEEQGLLGTEQVTDEVMVLAKKYETEMKHASALLKQFVNGRTIDHQRS